MASPLDGFVRGDLATIGRELMLAAHLHDRTSVPAILRRHTMAEALQLAIDEWMTASPIYTRRMQRAMGFAGDDVETIFKGLQLDVGFPHQFLDVGYELHDPGHGEFWLRSCGALADVLPMGPEMVRGMCHDIEDPTFDATAVATNPRAQVRPLHRPPEVPRGGPDCHWTVAIDESADPVLPHPRLAAMEGSVIAHLPNDGDAGSSDEGGRDDYTTRFDPHFELEHLSSGALRVVAREFAIQGHLLARAMMCAVDHRHGRAEAMEVGRAIFTGIGWVATERMTKALGVEADDPGAIAAVLPFVHFLLPVDYAGLHVDHDRGATTTTIRLSADAGGLAEPDPFSLPGLLAEGVDGIVESLVHGVDPTATVELSGSGTARSWEVRRRPGQPPVPEPGDVAIARFSTGVDVTLRRRVPVPRPS